MDLLEINARALSDKHNHIKHTIKYRKVVKKIISWTNIPEVLYKHIMSYAGSSLFPMTHPRYGQKNISISHRRILRKKHPPNQEHQHPEHEEQEQ